MDRFAIIEEDTVLNVISAETLEIAQECNPGKLCLQIDEQSKAEKNGKYINGEFIPKQPYNSWTWDGLKWEAPVSAPEQELDSPSVNYKWDEEGLQWVLA